jgi:hypothetical protein
MGITKITVKAEGYPDANFKMPHGFKFGIPLFEENARGERREVRVRQR